MNKQIYELAEQAGMERAGYANGTKIMTWREGFDNPGSLEKFAELIVRECANVALEQKKQVEEMEVYNLQDEVWNRARIQQSQQIVDKIKQHFGVK